MGIAGYFYWKYDTLMKDPAVVAQQEAKAIGAKVAALIEVPKDEQPSVATVTDKTKLTDQQFFAKTENGDKVVIYYTAGIAILYRPSQNKIIAVSPINAGNNAPSVTPTAFAPTSTSIPQTTTPAVSPTK